MTVGIIGLGLIGGSLAKAFCREEGNTVLGWDTDSTIVEFAQIAQAIHGPLTDERLGELDLLLLATYPEAVVEHMTRLAPLLSKPVSYTHLSPQYPGGGPDLRGGPGVSGGGRPSGGRPGLRNGEHPQGG